MCARERTITTCVHPPQQTKCLTPQDHHSDERTEDADPYRDFCQSVKKSKNTTKKVFITENRQFLVSHVHFVEGIK